MAEQKNFFVDDSKHSGSSAFRLLRFEESGVDDDISFCDEISSTKLRAEKLYNEKSLCDDVVELTERLVDKLRADSSLCNGVVTSSEVTTDKLHDDISCDTVDNLHRDKSFCNDVSTSTELMLDKVQDDKSSCDDIVKSSELMLDKVQDDKSSCDDIVKSSELIVNKLSEFDVKKSLSNSLLESQCWDSRASPDCSTSRTYWHSTPSVNCCVDLFSCPAVSGRPMQSCACGSELITHVVNESRSVVTEGVCDQEEVVNDCSPLQCQYFRTTAADDDADCAAGVADGNVFVTCNKNVPASSVDCRADNATTDSNASATDGEVHVGCNRTMPVMSPDCRSMEDIDVNNASADKTDPHTELIAVTTNEEIVCANGDKELGYCLVKDSEQHTTESVCQELSEMMQQCVVVDDNTVKQVLNCSTSDADVSDSFDLDVATKDLERAVSAGMLDFLLESYEDSDEDVGSEQMCELDDWSPASVSDDDEDDSSESTLTESATDSSDDSVVVDNDETDDDNDVLRRHERIKRRLKSNDDDAGDPGAAVITSVSDDDDGKDDDDDDDDVIRRHERINGCLKSTDNDDDISDHSATDVGTSTADSKSTSDDDGSDDDDADIKYINNNVMLTHDKRVNNCVKRNDCDDDSCDMNTDISTVDIICTHGGDDELPTRHERVKRLLKAVAPTADDDKCKTRNADVANANVYCGSSGDDDVDGGGHSLNEKCLMNASDVDDGTTNDFTTSASCTDDAQLVTRDTAVSTSEKCVFISNNNRQSVLCTNTESMSSAVDEYRKHDIQDKLNAATVSTCNAESAVCPGLVSSCLQQLSNVQNTDTWCNYSGETSLLLGELGAHSTSTPSSSDCSHNSPTQSVIEWREGVYTGLCRHSDGSDIRT